MDRLFSEKILKKLIPVFIDSPHGEKITRIYSNLSQFWDNEAKILLRNGDRPIDFEHLFSVGNYKNHKRLMEIKGPAIIVTGSGMCTVGRIIDHLINGIDVSINDVLFVGYQARGTLGRNILKYSQSENGYVLYKNKKINIKAKVYKLSCYSAHADQKGLIDFVKKCLLNLKKLKLYMEKTTQKAFKTKT